MNAAPTHTTLTMRFRSVDDTLPNSALPGIFHAYWPAYRAWILRAEPVAASTCTARLAEHMPELMPVFHRLLSLGAPHDRETLARFLSLYRPPRVVRGCSQAVLTDDDGPAMVRNYDHAPHLCDALVLRTAWEGVPVVATTDCLWGALDGVNAHGLGVALAFGGRPDTGDGFGAQLVVRYLLQVCRDAADMRAALARLPVSMPYTFVGVDASGGSVTAYAGPGRPTRFDDRPSSTNHQGRVEWASYARQCQTVERLDRIEKLLARPGVTASGLEDEFLRPPLYRTDHARGSGTLYTATHRPGSGSLTLRWPDAAASFSLGSFQEADWLVTLRTRAGGSR